MTDLEELRYPIGRFKLPATSISGVDAEQSEAMRLLPDRLRAAVAGLNDAQLDTPYREGGWNVRQVVHHLADSQANLVFRVKLALTEDCPTVKAYDEAAWACLPDYFLPIDGSLNFLEALNARFVSLLRSMSPDDFQREFIHPQRGRVNLATYAAMYDWHFRHHTAHITKLRERMGW